MTTKAKPLFYFNGIKFNTSFFDTEIDKTLKNYVNYDPTNTKLISNVDYIKTNISSLSLTSIGQNDITNNMFNLPTNTFEANPKSILQLVNNSSRNTQWVTPATVITDYVNYSNPNLISNVSGITTTISNLTVGPLICTTIQNNNNTLNCGNITSGTINSGSINANANLIETTGNLQSRGLSVRNVSNVDVATISNLGALVCTTIQNNNNTLNCGNITSGTINSGAINANANLIETTGNLQSRGISIRNVSNTESASISSAGNLIAKSLQSKSLNIKDVNNNDIATISTAGELVCTTIQNNNNTLNCGNITSGTINSGSINANANLIETTGNLQSRGLTIKNVSNVDVATISNLGALVCTTIQNNNNTLNCGAITSGSINSGAINANANLIQTTGNLQSRGLTIKNVSNVDVATISNLGALVCTTIQNNNNTLNCGAITSTSINTQSSDINCGTGSITCHTITATSNLVSTGGIIVYNGTNNTATVQQDGQITCKNFLIRQPGTSNFPLSISGTGDVLGNGADFVRLQATGLNIFNTLTSGTFGTLQASINNAGVLSCNSITSNNNTISAGTGAISTTTLNSSTIGGVLDIGANQTTGALSIGNNAGRTGAINIGTLTTGSHAINIGNSASTQTVTINRPLTTNTINTNNNTISAGTGAISTTTLNSSTVGGVLDIGSNQTTGALSIGNNAARTGALNIATLTTGTNSINIGNSASTQTININRPIRMPGFIYSVGNEIGYTQNDSIIFFSPTNPVLPGTLMNTPITTTNLINNANYLIKYSLSISPQANFNVTKFQYGLYTTGFVTSCSNNIAVLSGTTVTTTLRFLTSDTYSYSGSGFFKYNSATSYSLSYYMDFLATSPIIVTNIDLIRIS